MRFVCGNDDCMFCQETESYRYPITTNCGILLGETSSKPIACVTRVPEWWKLWVSKQSLENIVISGL